MPSAQLISEREAAASGGSIPIASSSRAGYLPVALASVPAAAFEGIGVYLRASGPEADGAPFTLYRARDIAFTAAERERLLEGGVKFVYVCMSDQARFRAQTETNLEATVTDPKIAISAKLAIVYETSVELINELLADPDLAKLSPRLETVSRAITSLVINNPTAFSHLFATSHHDFYTATHMVNVATYMVPLAHKLGYNDSDVLNQLCQAGLLHDIGKLYIPEEVLNKTGALSEEDWVLLKRHPEMACSHLEDYDGIPPVALTVARQHHERLDGSGYPAGLRGEEIHPFSRICAVVDAFDAMTALRPFKKRSFTIAEALAILRKETPDKHDADVVAAWSELLSSTRRPAVQTTAEPRNQAALTEARNRRKYPRYRFNCPARLHVVDCKPGQRRERPGLQVVAHSISRSGMGVLSQLPVPVGEYVHVYLHARKWNRELLEGLTVRCRSYADGWYEIGLHFTTIDTDRSAGNPHAARPA
jgi:HD-GYP domain-containing protein (c-di-GMP phosphodiesterase class II)